MNILTSGCSFSRGPTAWPIHIARWYKANLVNLAQSGAGNTYIKQSVIAELQKRNYDLVLIMWSGLERIDIQVSNIESFNSTIYTSKYQSQQNDWQEKIVDPINDQDYVQKDWVFGCGHINCDNFIVNSGLFETLYRYQDFQQHLQRSFSDMLCLESYLKAKNIPYAFAFYQDYVESMGEYSQQLDWSNIYNTTNLFEITLQLKNFAADGLHPGPQAQKVWARNFYDFLQAQ
jgi:hypothetical protein